MHLIMKYNKIKKEKVQKTLMKKIILYLNKRKMKEECLKKIFCKILKIMINI